MDITNPYLLTKPVCEAKMTSHHRVHVGKQVQNDSVLMNIIYTVKQIWYLKPAGPSNIPIYSRALLESFTVS